MIEVHFPDRELMARQEAIARRLCWENNVDPDKHISRDDCHPRWYLFIDEAVKIEAKNGRQD